LIKLINSLEGPPTPSEFVAEHFGVIEFIRIIDQMRANGKTNKEIECVLKVTAEQIKGSKEELSYDSD